VSDAHSSGILRTPRLVLRAFEPDDAADVARMADDPRSGGGPRPLLARASSVEERAAVGRQGGGRVWLFLETDDLARDHARFSTAGVHFDEMPRHEPFGNVAVFRDVCGNPWDLIEPKRRSPAA